MSVAAQRPPGALARWWDSDLAYSFRRSPVAVAAALVLLVILGGAALAPWIAPHNPLDLASLNLMDSRVPPVWDAEGQWTFPLGTDDQGRDILSGILYGVRISLVIGVGAVLFSVVDVK